MGGEPTFVSMDDFESPEWTIAALGPDKRRKGQELLGRLFKHYGKGGFLHYGQGKWYPGESLPRWSYSCIWRKDGQPLWKDPALLGNISGNAGYGYKEAAEFSTELCERLDVSANYLLPGYEDAWYYLWKERRLPTNVDPLDNRLETKEDRERMARVFEQGLKHVVGYTLPLERAWVNGNYAWITGPWFLRPETLFLIPGDSPMGLRLPLDSLPWQAASDYRFLGEAPVPENMPPLPDYEQLARQYRRQGDPMSAGFNPWHDYFNRFRDSFGSGKDAGTGTWQIPVHMRPRPENLPSPRATPLHGKSAPWIVRTALCIEPRDGNLYVFMPPVPSTEDYVDLLAAIEATASAQGRPVIIEGYLPPADPRLENVKVTPDPGVIEVNIHPSASWEALKEKTFFLYDAARRTRLATEKFDVDGAHTGTGGGNHIVVGGETPIDSPFLRRPKLLSSLLAYWHQHPGLSYLFSGKFIGPTSQAPRIDEARNDALYELEIAFRELDAQMQGKQCPPWLVDRIFRNLLIDVTGNTHRTEFCIDKLYSPDGYSGRLGLVEQRAYEMPPHAKMSLTQQLLLRGLIARFWNHPYEPKRLSRWDTQLHDKWMLPHFIMEDIKDVTQDLQRWGLPFSADWFAPHYDFRFPRYGEVNYGGISLEVRQALEPWHVMGEEAAGGGTARYVDSSVERIQVKARGMNADRYVLSCNGFRIPATNTGVRGEYVAGIRYRAWQPPLCLHPTHPVHGPLRIDVLDTWNNISIGGCMYHVTHPGGLGYTDFPVNALTAESRRLSRFESIGHTPGKVCVETRHQLAK